MSSCPGTSMHTARDVEVHPKAYEAVNSSSDVETASDFEEVNPRRSMARVAAVSVGVAAIVGVLVCGALYHNGAQASSSDMYGVVEYDQRVFAKVAPWIKPKPQICNEGIVLNFCLRLNKKPPTYFGSSADSPKAVVSVLDLVNYYMASLDSVTAFLHKIGAPIINGNIKCKDLCDKTMASFPRGQLPPMVDVGCYFKTSGPDPTCAVELGINVLAQTQLPRGSPGKLGKHLLLDHTKMSDSMKDQAKILDGLFKDDDKYDELAHPNVSFDQLKLEAARLFRVFPAADKVTLDMAPPTGLSPATTQRQLTGYSDTCASAKNNVCDVPFSCEDGTDCTDCGNCNGQIPDDTCHYAKDDECDEARYCLVGTDCSDCDTCGLGGEALAAKLAAMKPNDSCPGKSLDGSCDAECEEGTDCTDCGTCSYGGSVFAPPQYPDLVLRAGLKVQALLAAAHLGVATGEGSDIMMELVGIDNEAARNEIKRMIVGLSRMLDNVQYKFPGPKCEDDTYAYLDVGLESYKGDTGYYVMNLCAPFMQGNSMMQYSKLIAAGIRAFPMLANDEYLDGALVAGVDMVKKLALKCKVGSTKELCAKSARNAQTIVHVINKFIKLAM